MAKFIQKFQNQSAYEAAEHQYPNTSLVGNDIVFQMTEPTPPAFGGLTVKYNIVDTTNEVTLFNGGGASSGSSESESESGGGGALPTTMIVDGVSETPINSWRFETAGEHTVQYTFADNTVPQDFIDGNIATATEAIVGTDITDINGSAFDKPLTSATCLSTTPPTLQDNGVFGLLYNYPLYVPASSVATYKTTGNWVYFESRIEAIQ